MKPLTKIYWYTALIIIGLLGLHYNLTAFTAGAIVFLSILPAVEVKQ